MKRVLLGMVLMSGLAACSHRPTPTEIIRIVDFPADIRVCRNLGSVSGPVETGPDFDAALEAMLQTTVVLGGTDIYLQKLSADWSLVRGVVYHCGPHVRVRAVRTVTVRSKG